VPADARREQADVAKAELHRLERLFQDILDMARIEAGAIAPEREWVTAGDVVDAAIAYAGQPLQCHRLTLHLDAAREAHVDPRLTSMALAHILENAAHYSPSGSTIEIAGRADDDGLEVSVLDSGPGLSDADLAHLFDRFYRGAEARRRVSGTGMGLAITRGLLAAQQGRVWAENVSPRGARFTLVVRAATREVAADREEAW
jgi:two-component system sensor histidine kinase KdpD